MATAGSQEGHPFRLNHIYGDVNDNDTLLLVSQAHNSPIHNVYLSNTIKYHL